MCFFVFWPLPPDASRLWVLWVVYNQRNYSYCRYLLTNWSLFSKERSSPDSSEEKNFRKSSNKIDHQVRWHHLENLVCLCFFFTTNHQLQDSPTKKQVNKSTHPWFKVQSLTSIYFFLYISLGILKFPFFPSPSSSWPREGVILNYLPPSRCKHVAPWRLGDTTQGARTFWCV